MQLGMIGLGRMGASMAGRLMRAGHSCVVHDTRPDAVAALSAQGALHERFASRGEACIANQLLSAMRHAFGGHLEKPAEDER